MLRRVTLKGFKSIKEMDIELRALNVLIGANGAGKSNFVSFFKMINEMAGGRLQEFIGKSGRAHSLLYFGAGATKEIEAQLEFETPTDRLVYRLRLNHGGGDALFISLESAQALEPTKFSPTSISLAIASLEAILGTQASWSPGQPDTQVAIAQVMNAMLKNSSVYQFHDTSPTARVRQFGYAGDNRKLLSDAGNLAAFLLRLQNERGAAYQRIVATIRLLAPFFDNFELAPSGPQQNEVILNWREKGSDRVFGPHQFSDGTLRAISLIALLLQPENELPALIVVDEPEIGLHPYALNLIASLFKTAAHHTQVIISTQSSSFLDNFDPEDVIVVNRESQSSTFKRLDAVAMESWLEEYSLGEVWKKNVFGGGPH